MKKNKAFTIVELLIVIVVIAILATIAILAFRGVQKRAVESVVKNDLNNAAKGMELDKVVSGSGYAMTLPISVRPSAGVSLSLAAAGGTPVYSSLNPVQNAVLFLDTCMALIADGVGAKPSDGHDYVSECRVYEKNKLHVNGWNGRSINTPITVTSLQAYVSSYVGGEKDEFTTKGNAFMTQWASRFQAAGGIFPVVGFWDNWATATNGGVMKPTLPQPSIAGGSSSSDSFCINATSDKEVSMRWHIKAGGSPAEASCS